MQTSAVLTFMAASFQTIYTNQGSRGGMKSPVLAEAEGKERRSGDHGNSKSFLLGGVGREGYRRASGISAGTAEAPVAPVEAA